MTEKPSSTKPTALARVGAASALLLSLLGVGVGAYLTVLKFRMNYTPCNSGKGACAIGNMTCEDALASSWSMLFGLPISLWASAFYLVTGVLALGLLARRNFLRGAAAPILLALAVFDVLVSAVMGTYAFAVLSARCPYCLSLYVVSALLLVSALMARSGALTT